MHNMSTQSATQLLKRELRRKIRAALSAVPASTIADESSKVTARFLSTEAYKNASAIAVYDSMTSEFDTSFLIADAFRNRKRVFLPRIVSKRDHTMVMLQVNSAEDLTKCASNNWGIREPGMEEGRAESPRDAAIDVIIVPGLAFDAHGARCGQGMGFYDTYLRKYAASGRPMPTLVALALSVQIVDSVPTTDEDWPIDDVIFGAEHAKG